MTLNNNILSFVFDTSASGGELPRELPCQTKIKYKYLIRYECFEKETYVQNLTFFLRTGLYDSGGTRSNFSPIIVL